MIPGNKIHKLRRPATYIPPYTLTRDPFMDYEVGTASRSTPQAPRDVIYTASMRGHTLFVAKGSETPTAVYDFPSTPENFTWSLDNDMKDVIAYTYMEDALFPIVEFRYYQKSDNTYVVHQYPDARDPYLAYCADGVIFGYIRFSDNMFCVRYEKEGYNKEYEVQQLTSKHSLAKFGMTIDRKVQLQVRLYD